MIELNKMPLLSLYTSTMRLKATPHSVQTCRQNKYNIYKLSVRCLHRSKASLAPEHFYQFCQQKMCKRFWRWGCVHNYEWNLCIVDLSVKRLYLIVYLCFLSSLHSGTERESPNNVEKPPNRKPPVKKPRLPQNRNKSLDLSGTRLSVFMCVCVCVRNVTKCESIGNWL